MTLVGRCPYRLRALRSSLLLDTDAGDEGLALPRLRDLAAIVDSTPESVSRVIANLRRIQLLSADAQRRRLGLRATAVDCLHP